MVLFSDTRLPFLRNEINLRLLKFYSEEEGKILVLVVKDRAVKKLARSLGMRIDDSLGQRGRPVPKPAGGMPATHRPTTGMETPEMPPAAGTAYRNTDHRHAGRRGASSHWNATGYRHAGHWNAGD